MTVPRSLLAVCLTLAAAFAAPVRAAAPAGCVETLGADAAAVATAQADAQLRCLQDAAHGRIADPQTCLAADPLGRVAEATARTSADAIAACEDHPAFGVAPLLAVTANAAGTLHLRGLVTDLLGDDLDAALARTATDRAAARCQAVVLRGAQKLAAIRIADAMACQRAALAAGGTESDLRACVGRPVARLARTATKLAAKVRGRCGAVATAIAFPGACAGHADLAVCAAERAACRACRLVDSTGALGADCEALDDGADDASCRIPVSVSGNAIPFNGGSNRIQGADVWILEHPERHVTTDVNGHFQFDDLEEGEDVTLVLNHPDYHEEQTGTIRLGPQGAERVTFQAVVHVIYDALALILGVTPDPSLCQIVTTVTRVGKSLYDPGAHGEDHATVTLTPAVPAASGPIYFNSSVLPDRNLVETSDDGGVLFVNVPVQEYEWRAHKAGAAFSRLHLKCRPNVLVNSSPPWGLQRQS